MKTILKILIPAILSSTAFASDYYSHCSDKTGIYTYSPDDQELVFNTNEVYPKSSYTVHFSGLIRAIKTSCIAQDGKSYGYEYSKYTLEVKYRGEEALGAEVLECELLSDALPAALECVTDYVPVD